MKPLPPASPRLGVSMFQLPHAVAGACRFWARSAVEHPFIARYSRPVPLARKRRDRALATVAVGALTAVPLLCAAHQHRGLFRVNETPSEPPGVYVRAAHEPIGVGGIIAFLAPPPAFPYADRRAGYLHKTPILKAVAAAGGDRVCTVGGMLAINGVRRAPVQARDSQGYLLPHWIACRRLAPDELFVFSNRVPNSFDSRYYGPVRLSLAEAYRPFVTANGFWR